MNEFTKDDITILEAVIMNYQLLEKQMLDNEIELKFEYENKIQDIEHQYKSKIKN